MSQSFFSWRREHVYLALFLIPLIWLLGIQLPAFGSADPVFEPVPNSERQQNLADDLIRQGSLVFNPAGLNGRSSDLIEFQLFEDTVLQNMIGQAIENNLDLAR